MINCEKIKEKMAERGLSSNGLAERVGVSGPMMSFILRGMREPSLTVLSRIARELGCTTAELIEG